MLARHHAPLSSTRGPTHPVRRVVTRRRRAPPRGPAGHDLDLAVVRPRIRDRRAGALVVGHHPARHVAGRGRAGTGQSRLARPRHLVVGTATHPPLEPDRRPGGRHRRVVSVHAARCLPSPRPPARDRQPRPGRRRRHRRPRAHGHLRAPAEGGARARRATAQPADLAGGRRSRMVLAHVGGDGAVPCRHAATDHRHPAGRPRGLRPGVRRHRKLAVQHRLGRDARRPRLRDPAPRPARRRTLRRRGHPAGRQRRLPGRRPARRADAQHRRPPPRRPRTHRSRRRGDQRPGRSERAQRPSYLRPRPVRAGVARRQRRHGLRRPPRRPAAPGGSRGAW